MQCSACKANIQGDFKFCPHCGNKINTLCPSCGKDMMPDWIACPYCGLAAKMPTASFSPPNMQHPASSHYNQSYHSDSSGHHRHHKKGLLGSFFSG